MNTITNYGGLTFSTPTTKLGLLQLIANDESDGCILSRETLEACGCPPPADAGDTFQVCVGELQSTGPVTYLFDTDGWHKFN